MRTAACVRKRRPIRCPKHVRLPRDETHRVHARRWLFDAAATFRIVFSGRGWVDNRWCRVLHTRLSATLLVVHRFRRRLVSVFLMIVRAGRGCGRVGNCFFSGASGDGTSISRCSAVLRVIFATWDAWTQAP